VPHLGRRVRRDAAPLLGQPLEGLAPGVWRVRHLQRTLVLVSGDAVEVDRDSLPMHALLGVPEPARPAAARILGGDASLLVAFGGWLAFHEPVLWQEIVAMAAQRGETLTPDVRPLVEYIGIDELVRQIEEEQIVDRLNSRLILQRFGPDRVVSELGVDAFLAALTPEHREALLRRLQQADPANP